jgi:hypothetical protein
VAAFVYILCALTSLACALLLGRAYRQARHRLLLWSALCFVGLALNNLLLVLDLLILPQLDLSMARALTGLVGVSLLIYGLVWDGA